MKKLFSALAILIMLSHSANAQHCQDFDSIVANPGNGTMPGFIPSSDSLACIGAGTQVSDTIYFTDYSNISGFAIDSLTIDSIGNLPGGLCWVTNKIDNTFGPGENGVLYISGQCNSMPGQYKLQIFIGATGAVINIPPNSNAETAMGLRYYLRVVCPGVSCPAVDTTGGKDSLFIPYPGQQCTGDAVNEISGISRLSVVPNPFNTSAILSFYADAEETNALRLTDLLGNVVLSKNINAKPGSNEIRLDRNGVAAGLYLLSITNKSGSVTRKIVVE